MVVPFLYRVSLENDYNYSTVVVIIFSAHPVKKYFDIEIQNPISLSKSDVTYKKVNLVYHFYT